MPTPRLRMTRVGLVVIALICSGTLTAGTEKSSYAQTDTDTEPTSTASTPSPISGPVATRSPTVVSHRTIGHSVRGRPIRAYELGSRRAAKTVVVIGAMHGNEQEGSTVISALMGGRPLRGVHIWAIRRDNPDGYVSNQRRNARGVDLNRNFPTRWTRLYGNYYSGPRPASEPETRALMRFLNRVDPAYVVTMHSPLYGIDVHGAKDRRFARRLARDMRLPRTSLNCSGTCHGTLSQWFNRHHKGSCVTVEFGANPSSRYLDVAAPRGLVRAVGGRFK